MCIGFALNGGGEFAVPAPAPTPLPPPMLAFPRESPVSTLQTSALAFEQARSNSHNRDARARPEVARAPLFLRARS